MRIRCPNCLGIVGLETLVPGECPPGATCGKCETPLSLMSCGELGLTTEEQGQRASRYAEFNAIDLPSAYSILLGLMTLERARQERGEAERAAADHADQGTGTGAERAGATGATHRTPTPPPAAADAGTGSPPLPDAARKGKFDPGFRRAVREGHLTLQQAMQRGDRRLFAAKLARRHGIPMRLAALVADNKMSLHAATQRVRPPETAPPQPGVNARQKILMLSFAAVLLVGVLAQVHSQLADSIAEGRAAEINQLSGAAVAPPESAAATAPEPPVTTHVRADDGGQLVRIEGNTPESILEAFCAEGPQADRFEPLELVNAVPPSSWARMGLMRNFDDFDALYVIDILRDRQTGRWIAGNGADPIVPRPAPAGLESATTFTAGI